MKMMLILAAVLMTSATVYGVVEYRNRSASKEFKRLYTNDKEEHRTTTVLPARKEEVQPVKETSKAAEFIPEKSGTARTAGAKMETAEMKKVPAVEKKKKKTQKKLRMKMFSRSAPKEEVVLEN